MNDIKNLLIYGGLSLAVILGLIFISTSDSVSPGMVGFIAIIAVIVLPVIVAVKISSKGKAKSKDA